MPHSEQTPDGACPFDLNNVEIDPLEAVEYYAGPFQTLAKYSRLDSRCGVLVLWTCP